jgi:hypothetical protein
MAATQLIAARGKLLMESFPIAEFGIFLSP